MREPDGIKITALLLTFLMSVGGVARAADSQQSAAANKPELPRTPNIILIFADDVGLGDVGCTGGPFQTPHLDALAKHGLRFAQCYSMPLCGPSRCEILTGRYPFRTGLLSNQSAEAIQPGKEIMLSTALKKAGYVTASVGKWGQMSLGPGEWGFDEYIVFPGSGCYWRQQTTHYTVTGKQQDLPAGVYLPDRMHQWLVSFIKNHKDQPFFVYYPMSHIHTPIVPTPDSKPGANRDRLYADNIQYMDKLVGQLMDELDRLHLREKTLVLFVGDNGTALPGVNLATVNGRPISGMKGSMLEGGSRVPLIANWKGVTPEGKVLNDLVDLSDFFPTFVELAGTQPPGGVKIDGRSFAPRLRGEKGKPRDWIFVQLGGHWYVRDQDYKLTGRGALFDMRNAPFVEQRANNDDARQRLQAVLKELNPAGGKTLPPAAKPRGKGKKANRQKAAGE